MNSHMYMYVNKNSQLGKKTTCHPIKWGQPTVTEDLNWSLRSGMG